MIIRPDFQYYTDFLAMNAPELGHLLCGGDNHIEEKQFEFIKYM